MSFIFLYALALNTGDYVHNYLFNLISIHSTLCLMHIYMYHVCMW